MVENVCSLASETLNTKVYRSLRKEQKVNLSNNLKYMRDIIGISCTGTSYLQHQSTPEIPYFRRQGCSSLCGLCALNILVGREEFLSIDLDNIADEIWFQQISDGLSLIDEIQSTRSRDGYYCIEVLLLAANEKGMELESMNPNSKCMLGSATVPVKMLMGTNDEHYVAIHVYNDRARVFDSLLAKPIMISTTIKNLQQSLSGIINEGKNAMFNSSVGPIWQSSLTTLAPRMWLNDEVINSMAHAVHDLWILNNVYCYYCYR